MSMVVRPQSPGLAPFVRVIGYYEGEALPFRHERSLPDAGMSLMVNLHEDQFRTYHGPDHGDVHRIGGAMLMGPRTGHTVIDTAEQRAVLTVSFTLGGALPFLRLPLSEIRDQMIELEHIWGRDGAVLRERLCETATPERKMRVVEEVLLAHLAPPPRDPAVVFAARALERGADVSVVAAALGLLPKQFVRRFRGHVGLTPKLFSRVRRLQRLLRRVHGNGPADWAAVAVEHGYFDQAHLINDFRALTGITPGAYLAAVGGERNHVPI
ncbi:MAG: helix-turn-helix domain-containing protein [Micromonosporaceae bacterium]